MDSTVADTPDRNDAIRDFAKTPRRLEGFGEDELLMLSHLAMKRHESERACRRLEALHDDLKRDALTLACFTLKEQYGYVIDPDGLNVIKDVRKWTEHFRWLVWASAEVLMMYDENWRMHDTAVAEDRRGG